MPKRHFLRHFAFANEFRQVTGTAPSDLTALFAGWGLRMGTKKEGNQAIHDQTNPEIDQQTEVRP